MFNEETPIVHCDDIYSNKWYLQPSSYMNCGKAPGDICQDSNECSSLSCGHDNRCQYQDDGPSDSDGGIAYIAGVLIIIGLIIIIVITIIICCYCYKTKHKK